MKQSTILKPFLVTEKHKWTDLAIAMADVIYEDAVKKIDQVFRGDSTQMTLESFRDNSDLNYGIAAESLKEMLCICILSSPIAGQLRYHDENQYTALDVLSDRILERFSEQHGYTFNRGFIELFVRADRIFIVDDDNSFQAVSNVNELFILLYNARASHLLTKDDRPIDMFSALPLLQMIGLLVPYHIDTHALVKIVIHGK